MKLLIYLLASFALVLPMAWLAYRSNAGRGWLLSLLIAATGLGVKITYFLVYTQDYRGTDTGMGVFFTDLVCAALVTALILRFPYRLCWIPYNTGCMAALFGAAVLSTATAHDPQLGFYTLFTFAKAYALYWCVVNCLRVGVPWRYVWYGFVGVGLLVCAVAAKQFLISHIWRVNALFEHSNTIPTWVFCFMPALLLWGMCDRSMRGWRVWATMLVSFGLCATVVRTQSRAGVVALGAALAVVLLWALLRAPSARVRLISATLGIILILGAIAAAPSMIDRFYNAPVESGAARHEFNAAATRMADDFPVLGVGLNNFSYVLGAVPSYHQLLVVTRDEESPGTCHQIYRLTVAEMGWLGLALLLLVAGRFMALALLGALRSAEVDGMVCFGMFVGWGAAFAVGFLEWVLRQTPVIDMGMIAAAVTVVLAENIAVRSRRAAAVAGGARRYRDSSGRTLASAAREAVGAPVRSHVERGFMSKPC